MGLIIPDPSLCNSPQFASIPPETTGTPCAKDRPNLLRLTVEFLGIFTVFSLKGVRFMSSSNQAGIESQSKLVTDIKSVISEAEEMLHATAGQVGETAVQLRERIKLRLADAKVRLVEAEAVLVAKTKAAARATDDYVHESPWTAVGVAAAVGLLVGLIIGRR
jgi:ElaB/YqjD/DUF883 family membrane-anchored ribosome-binding protein